MTSVAIRDRDDAQIRTMGQNQILSQPDTDPLGLGADLMSSENELPTVRRRRVRSVVHTTVSINLIHMARLNPDYSRCAVKGSVSMD